MVKGLEQFQKIITNRLRILAHIVLDGARINKWSDILKLFEGYFAEIHLHDGSTAQELPITVYTKVTGFADDGESANCTPDATNNKITITKKGRYFIAGTFDFMSGSPNITFKGAAFLNAVEQDKIHFHDKIAAAGAVATTTFSGIIDVTAVPWDLDVRARHDGVGGVNFTPTYMNLSIFFIGKT
jgi:hypothetical protein